MNNTMILYKYFSHSHPLLYPMKRRSSNNILKAVAEVRRGFTTGANEFFYLTEEQVTSSPRFRMGLPPEPRRLDGGGVAEVPAFARGFTHIGHICWFGAGHPDAQRRLAWAFPPRLLPHSPGLIVSTLSGDLYPRDCLMLKTEVQHLSLSQFIPAPPGRVFLRGQDKSVGNRAGILDASFA